MKELDLCNNGLSSFAGKELSANLKKAELAIKDLSEEFRVFNHSNSQFAWNFFVLNHKGCLRNIRQISAEIAKKRDALIENKYRIQENLAEVDILKEELEQEKSPAKRKLIKIKISRIEETSKLAIAPIEGALKDIITLHEKYKTLIKEHEGFTEADFEQAEIAYWIRRCFSQCLRDMRQFGTVSKGEQEPIEQMGLNVLGIMQELKEYLEKVEAISNTDSNCLDVFLDQCVEKYSPVVEKRIQLVHDSCSKRLEK